jgi:hypothetical protein
MRKFYFLIFFILLFETYNILAQISTGGIPGSIRFTMTDGEVETIIIPSPDLAKIAEEDIVSGNQFLPRRFSVLLSVNADIFNSGTWTDLSNGSKIWQLKLKSAGALATSLYFDDFYLPKGVEFFLYDDTRKQVKGAYTNLNNHKSRLFATELIYGDAVTLELYLPSEIKEMPSLRISELAFAYRDIPTFDQVNGFGNSGFCEVNVGCLPEGESWQDEKNGVVRIQVRVSGSGFWCTGSLVNNLREDNMPYVLTADHCAFQIGHYATTSDLNQWLFYFKYESQTCEDPVQEPPLKSLVGAAKVAQGGNKGSTGSDFYLLELNQPVPESYNPYFIGWSADDEISAEGVTIHHPEGDIKKISTYETPLVTSNWIGNGLPSHWKVFWSETDNGWGVTEGGSSGSPLFNNEGKIIGTLTGGLAACESSGNIGPDKPDYYGKFSYHWLSNGNADTARLKPWLDPDNTGVTQLEGKTLGISDRRFDKHEKVIVFPNPAKNFITIKIINFEPSECRLIVLDIMGNMIKDYYFDEIPNNLMIDIQDIPEGVYFIKVGLDEEWIITRFIKG